MCEVYAIEVPLIIHLQSPLHFMMLLRIMVVMVDIRMSYDIDQSRIVRN